MALPLMSRDRVIGALTVQSVERGAFSDEDITLLQTMADQLANAIENASLFAQTQEALSAAEALYQTTQELFSARDEEVLYQLAMNAISNSGIDSSAIYMYVDYKDDAGIVKQMLEQKAIWTISGDPVIPNGTRFETADFVIEQLVPRYGSFLIKDIHADSRLTDQLRQMLASIGVTSLMILPLSTHQSRLGFLLVAYDTKDKKFSQKQTRFYTIIVQQMVVALENLRLLDASQKRVRREEIIREITGKIRNAVDIDDVLKTTVGELGKVLGASRGNITLGIGDSQPQATQLHVTKSSRGNSPNGGGTDHKTRNDKPAGNKENENHGQ
jgi:GAF domain-containing protein